MNCRLTVVRILCCLALFAMGCSEETPAPAQPDAAMMPADGGVDATLTDGAQPDSSVVVDMELPDANPVGTLTSTEAIEPESQVLLEEPVLAVVSAESHGLVVQTEEAFLLVDGQDITTLVEIEPGDEIRGGATIGDDFLIATSSGLFSLFEGELRPSPADELLSEIHSIEADGDGTLWILTSEGLHAWNAGQLFSISSLEVPADLAGAMTAIAPWQEHNALWFASESALTGLTFDGQMAEAWTMSLNEPVESIAGSADGLWVLTESELKMMGPDGLWLRYERPMEGTQIKGHHNVESIWLHDDDALSRISGDTISLLDPAPSFSNLAATADGSVLAFGADGLTQLRVGRFISLTGLSEGDALNAVASISISAPDSDAVTEIDINVDGEALEVEGELPIVFELDPANLRVGNHTLTVSIRYDDGEEMTAELNFLGPPGWAQDIEPLFVAKCGMCHGNRPDARSLETPMSWIEDFDLIVFDVETGRMPLGLDPLSPEEVDTVRGWGAGGYQE